jgi:hypothetical protein
MVRCSSIHGGWWERYKSLPCTPARKVLHIKIVSALVPVCLSSCPVQTLLTLSCPVATLGR